MRATSKGNEQVLPGSARVRRASGAAIPQRVSVATGDGRVHRAQDWLLGPEAADLRQAPRGRQRTARRRHHRRAGTNQGTGAGESRTAPGQRHPTHGQCSFRAGETRPQVEVVNTYIDRHRKVHGVEPISKVLQTAPLAYRRHAARLRDPSRRIGRPRRYEQLTPHVQRVGQEKRGKATQGFQCPPQ